MGRYVAFGVATTIIISKKKNYWDIDYDIFKNDKKIKKELGTLLDISKYDCKNLEKQIILTMKQECFNNNIHELIRELKPIIDCRAFVLRDFKNPRSIELNEEFNRKNYPLDLKIYEDGHKKGEFYCDFKSEEEYQPDSVPEYWLFEEKELRDNVDIDICYIPLWFDMNKIYGEDETTLLGIMNKMSRKYLKSTLSKNGFFFILG